MANDSGRMDADLLINDLLPFAEKMLSENQEFLPFGGHMKPDGTIVWEGAYDGDDLPLSQDLIDILRDAHIQKANEHQIRACATVFDVRTIPPWKKSKQDAICIELDHERGYSVEVYFPYSFDKHGVLQVEEAFAYQGKSAIFVARLN